jgi:alcohol dehydrogenase class IV
MPEIAETYRDLTVYAGLVGSDANAEEALSRLVEELETVFAKAGVPRSLYEFGVKEADIPRLAEEAAKQWTATFNPRTPSAENFSTLYHSLF